jgi:hypothetical protein
MTFPDRITASLFIGGVDYTEYVRPGSLKINNVLTQQIDTLDAILDAPPSAPSDWQEVVAYDGSEKIFGGYLLKPADKDGRDLGLEYTIAASDYSIRFATIRVKIEYQNMTDKAIIADLFSQFLPGEGFDVSTFVSVTRTHDKMRFNRCTLLDAIKTLASFGNADWYVDEDKKLHFFTSESSKAPFELSDNPNYSTSYPYNNLLRNLDGSGVINRVEVVGGSYQSADATFYLAGTGADSRVALPFKFHAPDGYSAIQVWRNDGTYAVPVWTALTVKVGYIDQLVDANDVLFYFGEKVLEQATMWPALANAVKITAKYDVPLRTRITDPASFAHYGMYFDGLIVDNSITSKATAKLAAKALLAKSSICTTALSFSLYQPGLRAGQVVKLRNELRNIAQNFLVQRVAAVVDVNGRVKYDVAVGVYSPTLIDLIMSLAKASEKPAEWLTNEVLDEILQQAETITFAESFAVSDSVGPYYISPDPLECADIGFCCIAP